MRYVTVLAPLTAGTAVAARLGHDQWQQYYSVWCMKSKELRGLERVVVPAQALK